MNAYDFAGLVGGLTGAWMAIGAGLVGVAAALRLAAVRGRPGKGRVSRGALAFALVMGVAGLVLFVAAERAPFRRALDHAAPAVVAVAALVGLVAGWRAARKRPAPPDAAPAAPPGPPAQG
ncbi:hypothetical protein [Anaeromyxobacter sp. PSR-1]|uniref:hypothetical protein n=1 Tax=Anaeromyxobacter sp. PSR-1 TaxID=1300915 RepID=UPI0005E56EE4|nr:hypothetical protein [Anaeromyxobacter sp. PSR-1]GAO02993.1 hypothetical protein PSR1_01870 [Anaeromyxobacter sp. PSR-1]